MKFRIGDFLIIQQPLNTPAPLERIIQAFFRPNVMVLQIHQCHARVIPSTAFPFHVRLDHLLFGHPIEFRDQLPRVPFEFIQDAFPSHQHVLRRGRQLATGVKIMRGPEIGALDGKRIGHASLGQLQIGLHGEIT